MAALDALGAAPVFGAVAQRNGCEHLGGVGGHPTLWIGPELEEDQHGHVVRAVVGAALEPGPGQALSGGVDPGPEGLRVVVGGRVELMCQVGLLFSGQRPPPGFVGRALILQSACDSRGPVSAGYLYAVDNCILS